MPAAAAIFWLLRVDGRPAEAPQHHPPEAATAHQPSGVDGTGEAAPTNAVSLREPLESSAPEEPSSTVEAPPNSFAPWHGRPTGEFLASYWGLTQAEVLESIMEFFPEDLAQGIFERPVGDHLVEWEQALPLLKQSLRETVESKIGQIDAACWDAWKIGINEVLSKINTYSTRTLNGPAVSRVAARTALSKYEEQLLEAHTAYLESVIQHGDRLLESGDVDRFPAYTMPQGRGKQSRPAPDAPFHRMFNLVGGGWVAQFGVFVGGSNTVDAQHRRLREMWLDVLPKVLTESSGIVLYPDDFAKLGLTVQ